MSIQRTACNRDCPDACEILATVEEGRVTHLRGARITRSPKAFYVTGQAASWSVSIRLTV